ncbi:MAG: nucleoside deaminase [Acidimicrobiia bacterium]
MEEPPPPDAELDLLRRVLAEAEEWAESGGGGPFAAAVTLDGEVLALARNEVAATGDPTAHAEMTALRTAARVRGNHDLSGAVLVASAEPCPMCLAAAWWARVDRVLFSAGRNEASAAGFDDTALYEELAAPLGSRRLPITQALEEEGTAPFRAWARNPNRVPY